jgi:hypothetical protein
MLSQKKLAVQYTINVSYDIHIIMPSINLANSTCTADLQILDEVIAIQDEIFQNRRWFHEHPELSFEEFQTARKVVDLLRSYGITEIWEGVGKTGVVALIRGGRPGKCIALRADMDALPITETADVPYKSQNDGVMHACGHDGHMSGLLAAAKILFDTRDTLSGLTSSQLVSTDLVRCCEALISTCGGRFFRRPCDDSRRMLR